ARGGGACRRAAATRRLACDGRAVVVTRVAAVRGRGVRLLCVLGVLPGGVGRDGARRARRSRRTGAAAVRPAPAPCPDGLRHGRSGWGLSIEAVPSTHGRPEA